MRPIDADALLAKWNEKAMKMVRDKDGAIPIDFSNVISALILEPTLDDLRPHGRWEEYEDGQFRCSVCKKKPLEIGYRTLFVPAVCYHCGADMRGGGEE